MRLAGPVGALLIAISFPATAQWTDVRMPERVFTAVPFMIDLDRSCPPPGEAPPPIDCLFPIDVWFDGHEKSALIPKGFTTVFPFEVARAGPFTFHKPGVHLLDVLFVSPDFPDDVMIIGQVRFLVEPPGPARRNR